MGPKTETDEPRGRRVYIQIQSPKTGHSTTVTLPIAFVGEVEIATVDTPKGKRVVGVLGKNDWSKVRIGAGAPIVALDPHAFAVGRRQAIALAARRHPGWTGVAKPAAAAKPRSAPKRGADKGSKPRTRARGSATRPARPKKSPGLQPHAQTSLDDASAGNVTGAIGA